jgi:putative flippase GtrA
VAGQRREMVWQLIRYGVNGGLVTLLYAIVYAALVRGVHTHPQIANLIGQIFAVLTGYLLHSRVTFHAHGDRDRGTQVRFLVAALISYSINAFWTWLMIDKLHLSTLAPLGPICLITPLLLFAINRQWVFR